jgi:hypothetical protein
LEKRTLQLAFAAIPLDGKDEDASIIRRFGNRYLLAVADGLTQNSGQIAARAVIRSLEGIEGGRGDAHAVFARLRSALPGSGEAPDSQTTLTCGVLSMKVRNGDACLVFDFFAIGDSPVWRVVRAPDGDRYSFQRYALHAAPYPAETSKVYGTLRPHHPDTIQGAVTFGCAEIPPGDVLVICTDGIPEREVFVRDQVQPRVEEAPSNLCDWLFATEPYSNDTLEAALRGYAARGVLYDDATIIAARIAPPAKQKKREKTPRGSVSAAAPHEREDQTPVPECVP